MRLDEIPLFARLDGARRVLVAGAGGGYDVFCGVPLALALEARGHDVHLANLSFTPVDEVDGPRLTPDLVEVRAETPGPRAYFPERALSRWFRDEESRDVPIHTFRKCGVRPLRAAYAALVEHIGVDAVLLVDGGTDSLMRGDEEGLGTPMEDMASIAAVDLLDVPVKALACLGFGVDAFHGVSHAHFLEAVADLSRAGGFLGVISLLAEMPEARRYAAAVEFAHREMRWSPSIVNASILSALEGSFGDVHRTKRTEGSRLFINPLMTQYFTFDLDAVADRVLYLNLLTNTETPWDVLAAIDVVRSTAPIRPRRPIPL